mgnify:FL=1
MPGHGAHGLAAGVLGAGRPLPPLQPLHNLHVRAAHAVPAVPDVQIMTRMGSILAAGILDAGGRNVTIGVRSRSGYFRCGERYDE